MKHIQYFSLPHKIIPWMALKQISRSLSFQLDVCHRRCVTNQGEAGVGWIPTRPTTAYQVCPKNNRHTPVMVYNDLMIRNNSVYYYNTNWSRPVTYGVLTLGLGHRSTGMICPNRTLDLGSDYSSFLPYGFQPVIYITSVNIRYCLITLVTQVVHSNQDLSDIRTTLKSPMIHT